MARYAGETHGTGETRDGGEATTLYLVRHAHSPWIPNAEARRPLSERGREDAAAVARLLADDDIDAVVSSPYARARQTVRPVADDHGLDVSVEADLRERRLTDGPVETIGETFESAIDGVWSDWEFAWPGGESNRDAQARGVAALERIRRRHAGRRAVVGTHGNLMTLILNRYDDRYGYEFWATELAMPDVYEMRFEGDELRTVERRWAQDA